MRQSLIAVLACIALSVACDNSGGDSSTSPTATVVRTTDTYTGTVQPMSSDTHNFNVSQAGQVDVSLTAAGPPSTIFMGLGVGSPSGGTCAFANGAGVGVNTQAS